MMDTSDREITFRRPEVAEHADYEDANETLDDHRLGPCDRGEGDPRRSGTRRFNRDGQGDGNTMMPYKLSVKPETFDGVEDWEEYISHFEICAELGRWSDHEKLLALGMALKGPARTFYISLSLPERQTYAALVTRLGQRFGSTRQKSRWLSRLESRKRGQGETVAALADDLRQMAQRAYSDLDGKAQEVLALNQLYKSVPPEIKYQCTNQGCETVTDAVEIIERYEAIVGDSTERKRSTVRMVSDGSFQEQKSMNVTDDPSMTDAINKLTRLVDRLDDRSSQASRGYSKPSQNSRNFRKPMACHFCGKTDHLIKNCIAYSKCKEEFQAKQQYHNKSTVNQKTNTHGSISTSSFRNQGNFSSPLAQ